VNVEGASFADGTDSFRSVGESLFMAKKDVLVSNAYDIIVKRAGVDRLRVLPYEQRARRS